MEVPQLRNETETTKEGISQLIFHQLLIHLSFIFSSFLLQDIFPPKKMDTLIPILAFLIPQLVKNPPATQETLVWFLGRKIRWRRDRLPTPIFLGFPHGSAGKESTCNAADLGLIPGLGRSPGEGKGYSLQYSGLENSKESQRVRHDQATFTSLYFTFTFYFLGNLGNNVS